MNLHSVHRGLVLPRGLLVFSPYARCHYAKICENYKVFSYFSGTVWVIAPVKDVFRLREFRLIRLVNLITRDGLMR